MARLTQMLQSESQQEEEGVPPLSPLAPAICLQVPSPQAASLEHLRWWLRNLTVHFTRFTFDSFSHQVWSYFLCFLPCGWGPASSSAQQAEPGKAITAPRWTPLSLKGAFLGGSPGAADVFSQGFVIASPPVPRGIWLQLCSPLGLSMLFTHFQPVSWRPDWPLHFSRAPELFCSSPSAASASWPLPHWVLGFPYSMRVHLNTGACTHMHTAHCKNPSGSFSQHCLISFPLSPKPNFPVNPWLRPANHGQVGHALFFSLLGAGRRG